MRWATLQKAQNQRQRCLTSELINREMSNFRLNREYEVGQEIRQNAFTRKVLWHRNLQLRYSEYCDSIEL